MSLIISKIEKHTKGLILLKNAENEIIQAFDPVGMFLQRHPQNANILMISKTANSKDVTESIGLDCTQITEINGEPFSGDLNDLIEILGEVITPDSGFTVS